MAAAKARKTAEMKAPAWLDRTGKRMFRRVVEQLPAPDLPLSDAKVDLISDYVEARQRITVLGMLLGERVRGKAAFQIPDNVVMALTRQIDASTNLALKLADKLGLNA